MKNTPINQFKQALERYFTTYKNYFSSKLYSIDHGGCGEFAYLLKQPLETLINHFELGDKVKVSYVFLEVDSKDIKAIKQTNKKCINKNRVFVEECFFNPTLTQLSFCVMKASVYNFFLKNCTKEKSVNPVDIFHYFAKRLLPYFYQSECNDTYSELIKYQKQEVKRLESRYDD